MSVLERISQAGMSVSTVRYAIDAEDRICSVDDGWREFAEANDGAELMGPAVLGRSLWEYVTDSTTRALYQQIVSRVRQGTVARFTLRCDGPACRRLLDMTISAAADGAVEFVTHALRVEERTPEALLSRRATRSTDLLRVCSWCNRMKAGSGSCDWVEVEDATRRLRLFELGSVPQLSHGICETCFATMTSTLEDMDTAANPGAAPDGPS